MTGLQTDPILLNLVEHLGFVISGGASADTPRGCTQLPDAPGGSKRIGNGIQIFPGSVPIYRGDELVGGIGVSGDGIDQDDMVSFFDCQRRTAGWGIGNARSISVPTASSSPMAATCARYAYALRAVSR